MKADEVCDRDELVALLQAGDLAVLDRVTRCFGERLFAAGRRHCAKPQDVDDAVQDAALAAWRYGPGFRAEGSVEGWLVRLVATSCRRLGRGMKRDSSLHLTDVDLLSDDDSPELLAARAGLAQLLGNTLLDLSPVDRAIVLLADGQGMTGPEIAQSLSLTPGAVRSRLSRAHRRLRDALAQQGLTSAVVEV